LHLFVDWKWDIELKDPFMVAEGDGWFPKYRPELGLAGGYAFHHTAWSRKTWTAMDAVAISEYGAVDKASPVEIKNFVSFMNRWHNENNIGPSSAFPPERIEQFIDKTVRDYVDWRNIG
jgi:hypothetical protein